jgi:hypothetical protein
MHSTVKRWLGLSREELDDIYRAAEPGSVPNGDTQGTAIVYGSVFARYYAFLAGIFAWQGKVFDLFPPDYQRGILVNKVLPAGMGLIVAKVYRENSWLDGKETIVIDYSKTSLLARSIRDEIREVEPGVYLGKVWLKKKRILDFALTTRKAG